MTSNAHTTRARGDGGLTFIELLAAILILGVCVVFILGGTTFLPIASSTHRQDAQADTILRNWAEAVKAKGLVTDPVELNNLCLTNASNPYSIGSLQSYLPAGFSMAGFNVVSLAVDTWDDLATPAFQSPCDSSGGVRFARVHLTLQSVQTAHPVSQSLEVVVANL